MRTATIGLSSDRFILHGENIQEQAEAIGETQMLGIMKDNFRINTKKAYTERSFLNQARYVLGRAGEVGLCGLLQLYWDVEKECLVGNWSSQKTSRQKLVVWLPHVSSCELDMYHSLGTHPPSSPSTPSSLTVLITFCSLLFYVWRSEFAHQKGRG